MKKECCNINEVVQEYYNYLKAYITAKVKDPVIAEDIVQEVMVKFVDSYDKQTEIQNIKAWLFQVSRNTMYDYFKKRELNFNFEDEWEYADESQSDNSKIVVSDFVVPMIELLDPKYSVPLYLSDIEKIPQKEIASKLNLSLSATKMRVQRARKMLQEMFVSCCEIEYDKQGNLMGCTIKEYCEPLKKIEKDLNSN